MILNNKKRYLASLGCLAMRIVSSVQESRIQMAAMCLNGLCFFNKLIIHQMFKDKKILEEIYECNFNLNFYHWSFVIFAPHMIISFCHKMFPLNSTLKGESRQIRLN